ncbi:helicase [Citrobacter amalonaticus]|uniref:Helicase n=1 Tax=Citrobacter amalonaticus TaxID=35703 RepID=A0A2S4RYE6_CITAM|nr:AAA domain-containing protein [Citrobacter amalonaticus]POT57777.1 helicase [Citrobacter amalonaticus]POT76696.1 helicase [Citrobacter amalonaticus]POU65775.1 helicase [Citrobacter amalonaticus]POV05932.1 helicase [Citrobacter amalonaticus]
MVTVYVDGDDKTGKITDWTLRYHKSKQCLELTCHFPSGKTYTRPFSACRVEPSHTANGTLLIRKGRPDVQTIARAEIVGNKYALIYYPGSTRCYVMKAEDVQIAAETTLKEEAVFNYFRDVAKQRACQAGGDKKAIADNICRQLEKIVPHPDIALHAYCRGTNATRRLPEHLIYPFGLNESQMKSVEQAFSAQISVIEGPPGTGKTQTILNILANIMLQQRSVAIVSNNNAPVDNVYEKLAKVDLDYVIARLGSAENRSAFFAERHALPPGTSEPAPDINAVTQLVTQLKAYLRAQNEAAQLRAEIDELIVEEKYLLQWLKTQEINHTTGISRYGLAQDKITDLMAFMQSLTASRIGLRDRLVLLFKFKIIRTAPLNTPEKRQAMFFALQRHYYATRLQQTRETLASHERRLQENDVETLQKSLTKNSMALLRAHLRQFITPADDLNEKSYQKDFATFLKRYPVISSSTHSIVNSLANGTILDYLIIDEASQQDIIPGILALGCARNVIVVGDRKQLSHVPVKSPMSAPAAHYDCVTHSLLDSLIALYGKALPSTLLKEHYRCHPKIIQFCNKQFYDNQLICMTRDKGEPALSLVVTAKDNHTRNNSNLRELESYTALSWDTSGSRGFIAPYNAQVNLSHQALPADFVSATVHKFQGRECEEIVFSTVLDKKADAVALSFVDDPQLINVAVSRAQKRFTLVTGDNVFSGNNQHIAALIRYMTYYADDTEVHYSPVVSAFDLLYSEYDRSLERLKSRLPPVDSGFLSEHIAAQLIKDTLVLPAYHALTLHQQVPLRQLIARMDDRFTLRQQEFMAQGASCDFVLYYRVGKQPLAVIEVDGGSHTLSEQRERDALKDAILQECGIALLRLRTIDSQIETKIAAFLASALQQDQNGRQSSPVDQALS